MAGGAGLRMCGRAGRGDDARVSAMAGLLGDPPPVLDHPGGAVRATSARPWAADGSTAASWSPTPLPESLPPDARAIASRQDAASLVVTNTGTATLCSGISGAAPLYVDLAGPHVYLSSHVDPLARTRSETLRADWDGWAQIIAMGGPLAGRTTFEGIHRMQPWSSITIDGDGHAVLTDSGWPWLDVAGRQGAGLDDVRDAMQAAVTAIGKRGPLVPLLSGGWDSRILSTLAARVQPDQVTAWTTSSDTGTVLEELVAAQVADRLGMGHRLVPPRRDAFAADLAHFADAVDYQTSFHVWLVPLARRLAGVHGTVLDGLGGGLFVGGAFPDVEAPTVDNRFERMARYLGGAKQILHPRVTEQLRERTRAGFEQVAKPLLEHPFGSTFTAYLTRTLPGISFAPYGLVARHRPAATPFLDDDAVRAALAIPPEQHADGRLYPQLLRPLEPDLADLPTAADLTPQRRQHRRRVSSLEAAQHFRDLLTREPVRGLLAPALLKADIRVWRSRLDNTRFQHLIRSLATLSLWLERYQDILDDASVDALRGSA